MDIDEDDDFYAPDEPEVQAPTAPVVPVPTEIKTETKDAELEEGEEEDSGGEMDEDDDSVCIWPPTRCFEMLTPPPGHRNCHRAKRRHQGRSSDVSFHGLSRLASICEVNMEQTIEI